MPLSAAFRALAAPAAGLLLIALAACADDGAAGPAGGNGLSEADSLRLACQTLRCVCVSDGGMFDTRPDRAPGWSEGTPFCAEGFRLQRADD